MTPVALLRIYSEKRIRKKAKPFVTEPGSGSNRTTLGSISPVKDDENNCHDEGKV